MEKRRHPEAVGPVGLDPPQGPITQGLRSSPGILLKCAGKEFTLLFVRERRGSLAQPCKRDREQIKGPRSGTIQRFVRGRHALP